MEHEKLIDKEILIWKIEFERCLTKTLTQEEYYSYLNLINSHLFAIYRGISLKKHQIDCDNFDDEFGAIEDTCEQIIEFIEDLKPRTDSIEQPSEQEKQINVPN